MVDDDRATRTLLKDALSEVEGWIVTAVEDGALALEMLNSVQPHLVVLDVNMPGIDGLELYRLLREREGLTGVPVLFVSAAPAEAVHKLDGHVHYLPKPFDVDNLVGTAATLMGVEPPDIVG